MVERKLQLQVRVLMSGGRSRDLKHRETALQKALLSELALKFLPVAGEDSHLGEQLFSKG